MAKRISEQGNAPGERTDRALCALHKPARSVRYPDSLRSIRTQIRWSEGLKDRNVMQGLR